MSGWIYHNKIFKQWQKKKIVKRKDIHDPEFRRMLRTEKHHKHVVVKVFGQLRWEQNTNVRSAVDKMGIGEIMSLFGYLGCNYNSEIVRKLYRDIGYSLQGYWEIFYWDANNDIADEMSQIKCRINKISQIKE